MDPWQAARQIRWILANATWPDAGGTTVFGSVVVVTSAFAGMFANFRSPSLAVRPGSCSEDPEDPGLLTQQIELLLCVAVHGDPVGQNAVIGGNRTAGQVRSEGRGLLEVEEEVRRQAKKLGDNDGLRIVAGETSDGPGLVTEEKMPFAVTRSYTIDVHCTSARYYHAPKNLVATGGAGIVTLSWTLPPTRFDTRRVVVRRATGATPPASATAGTDVPVATLATGVVDSVAAGTYSYAVFMAYDESGSSTDERFSEQETGTTRSSVVAS